MKAKWLFGAALAAAGLAANAHEASAGRRCRTCAPSGGGSQGSWFHFDAPQVFTTPRPAPTSYAVSYPTGMHPTGMHRHTGGHVVPCSHCGHGTVTGGRVVQRYSY